MKFKVTVGSVCVVIVLWSVYSVTGTSLQFPEPNQGYRNELVDYGELPPNNAAAIDLGAVQFGSFTQRLRGLPANAEFEGFEVVGLLKGIASRQASRACIAVDFTRRSKQEHQLIASRSEFFELAGGEAKFRLPIRFPDYDETMELTVMAIVMDVDGVPIGSEFVLATGNLIRPTR